MQASTLGSMEALLEFLKTSEVPVSFLYFYLVCNMQTSITISTYSGVCLPMKPLVYRIALGKRYIVPRDGVVPLISITYPQNV